LDSLQVVLETTRSSNLKVNDIFKPNKNNIMKKALFLLLTSMMFFLSVGSVQALIVGHLCGVWVCHDLTITVYDGFLYTPISGASVTVKRYFTGYNEGTQFTNSSGITEWRFDIDKYVITVIKSGYVTSNETFDMQNYSMGHNVFMNSTYALGEIYLTPHVINATENFKVTIITHAVALPVTIIVYGFMYGEPLPTYLAFLPPMMNDTYQYSVNTVTEGLRAGYYTFYANITDSFGVRTGTNLANLTIQSGDIVPPTNVTADWNEPNPAVCNVTSMRAEGMAWTLPFCTPFFWAILVMLISSTIVGYAASKSGAGGNVGGVAFLSTVLVFSLMYILYGIFPAWIGILFVIGEGMALAYMLSKVFGG
jgi:hypothetical protein